MDSDARKRLEPIVERLAEIREEKKQLSEEEKELIDAAQVDCNVQPKVTRQLAKEKGWNDVERMRQKQLEEELDDARVALGLLADTPLGEHATGNTKNSRNGKARKQAREPAHV